MTAQIIFPDRPTYWIITNGSTYIDGYTSPGNTTTFGNGTQIYWIGTDFDEYTTECENVGLRPRNLNNNRPNIPVIHLDSINTVMDEIDNIKQQLLPKNPNIDPMVLEVQIQNQQEKVSSIDSMVNNIVEKQDNIEQKVGEVITVVPGVRISATQARLWLIQNGFDLNSINGIIDTIEDPIVRESVRAQWEYAPYIERNHPWLQSLSEALGIDLDKVFSEASQL